MKKWIYPVLILIFLEQAQAVSFEWMPDRRKDQFPTEQAHLVVPLPYSYPGIGEGFFLIGNLSNIGETTADGVVVAVIGDATGAVFQGDEIPILENQLLLHLYIQDINRAVVNNYEIRGMDGGIEYNLLDITRADENRIELKYTAFERRLNIYAQYYEGDFELDAIRDSDGNLIKQLAEPYQSSTHSVTYGISVDFTDDYLDPRRGVKLDLKYSDISRESMNDPNYYVLDYSGLFYIPFFRNDVLVLNYYQSDAHVREIGNVDPAAIQAELDIQCDPTDSVCLQIEQELIASSINARTNGTATSLGGLNRLRSFPEGRFQGGRMAFIGAEYRLNFTDEATPFNYLFWKDVRTGMQIALFTEVGTVAETSAEIWDETRSSVGVGFRLVAASGSVYRADIAYGEEGTELAVFFFYPW